MSSKDERGEGIVQKKVFDEMLRANGVFISNEELKLLFEKFGDNSGKNINYIQLSD
jgi:Ca2+-binding EF-hand superfamily protein